MKRIIFLILSLSLFTLASASASNTNLEETTAPIATNTAGPYLNGAIGLSFYKSETGLAGQVGYGYVQPLTTVNPVAPIFLGAEANFSRYGYRHHAASIDALALFGLQLNKTWLYLKAGPNFIIAKKNDFSAKSGVGISYPLFKTFRAMLEVQYTRQSHHGVTSAVSGLQYYF